MFINPSLQEAFSGSGLSTKWYQFGLKLNLTSSELHAVEKKCRGKPLFQFLTEMLKIWLGKSPVWSTMVLALRGIDENDLADKIKEQYGGELGGLTYILEALFPVNPLRSQTTFNPLCSKDMCMGINGYRRG